MASCAVVLAQETEGYDGEKTYQAPSDPLVKEKIAHWQDLKFGLFMHWGTYSQWGIVESWSLCPEDRKFTQRTGPNSGKWADYKKSYENLQTTFNPTAFNPEVWANAAKDAGMKYVVFTTKHHDGFSMFDTKYTDYSITNAKTPFSKNPRANVTKEIFNAFGKNNFMIGAYFSKPDWHSEDYWWSYFPPKDRTESYDRKKYPDRWKRFTDFTFNQVQELMTGYGKVDLLWFDGDWAKMDMTPIVTMARKEQPGIIVVDRHGKPEYVNYTTPEQKVPAKFMPHPWETCITMGKHWSFQQDDQFKPVKTLVQLLVDVVAKNGNLLLNIGPGPDGQWHKVATERLAEIGKWMRVNGESIYGTKPFAPYREAQWAFTKNASSRYLSYLPADNEKDLPAKLLVPLKDSSSKTTVKLLGTEKKLVWTKTENGIEVSIPPAIVKQLSNQPVWVFKVI